MLTVACTSNANEPKEHEFRALRTETSDYLRISSRSKPYSGALSVSKPTSLRSVANELSEVGYIGSFFHPDRGLPVNSDCYASGSIFDQSILETIGLPTIRRIKQNTTKADKFTFATSASFKDRIENTYNNQSNLALNLALFEIGASHEFKQAFSRTLSYEDEHVYGELDVLRETMRYKLINNAYNRQRLMGSCYDESFLWTLYNEPMANWFDPNSNDYSDVVITDCVVGGVATVLFSAKSATSMDSVARERSLLGAINASYKDK